MSLHAASESTPIAIRKVLVVMVTSEADGQAAVEGGGGGVRTGADAGEGGVPANAVHLRVESAVAGKHEQVLPRQVEARHAGAGDEARRHLVAERDGLETQERTVLDERA